MPALRINLAARDLAAAIGDPNRSRAAVELLTAGVNDQDDRLESALRAHGQPLRSAATHTDAASGPRRSLGGYA